jgi:prevent-host-death family protein
MLKTVTAKELKNRTGEVLRAVGRGARVVVTRRGKPHALLSPVREGELAEMDLRPLDEAWASIEESLEKTSPRFPTWREAIRWSRRRA